MSRIFILLTALALLMILISGAGTYWLITSDLTRSKQAAADALVSGAASTISAKIDVLNQILEKMTQDPDVIMAVNGRNPDLMATVAEKLERSFPSVQKIRLLPPDVTELDDKNPPKMSLADLDMVRDSLKIIPLSAIHGDILADRHLAIARKISLNDQAIGVILASLEYDFLTQALKSAQVKSGGYYEIRQDKLMIAFSGKKSGIDQEFGAKKTIANTVWELQYNPPHSGNGQFQIIAGMIALTLIAVLTASLLSYRKLARMLLDDLSSAMSAFKDMMKNKLQGSYPFNLNEFNIIISTLAQYKRLQFQEDGANSNLAEDDQAISDLLWDDINLDGDIPVVYADKLEILQTKDVPQKSVMASNNSERGNEIDALFRSCDIRGIAGSLLTQDVVHNIGRALGTEARKYDCKTIVVGWDGRTSSPGLSESLMQGILSTGCNVLNIGMVPTPLLYFVTQHVEGRCGVMVTGGHNSAQYNGLKMLIKGEILAGDRIKQLKQCIEKQSYTTDRLGTIERNERFANEYIGTITEDVRIARPMRIVLDCGNGVAGELAPVLLKTLGCEVLELFCDVDGSFPNHQPDPSQAENMDDLIMMVKRHNADLGLAIDGDGDRLGVVDSEGKMIWPDRLMMLFAKNILAAKPGSQIIYDVKCSRHLAEQITKYGGRPLMAKTGHSFIRIKLKESGAKLAGEMSGHIFFNDRWFGFDDALYSAARLIEMLSADTRSSAEVFNSFPESFSTPEFNVAVPEGENFKIIENLMAAANFTDGEITTIDGIRVDFPDGWGLVRASNTTPSLQIRFEADTREALKIIQDRFRQQLLKVKPGIVLPF